MQKRPDAEHFLSMLFKILIILGTVVFFIGLLIGIDGTSSWGVISITGVAIIFSSIGIVVIIRVHNVLLDIRDVLWEHKRLLNLLVDNTKKTESSTVDTTPPEAEKMLEETEAENPDKLDEWKDTQILKAKAAFDAGKITEEKYTSYVTKVLACKKIPEKKND